MAREFGQENPDGTITVVRENDDGTFTPLRTESRAVNQAQAPAAASNSIDALAKALQEVGQTQPLVGNIEPSTALKRQSDEYIANMQDVTQRAGLGVNLYSQQNQMAMQVMQTAYLRERERLLEIPEMRNADERARAGIALDAATQLATQTGWINPGDFNKIIAMQMKVLEASGEQDIANDFWGQNPDLKAMYDQLQGQMGTQLDQVNRTINLGTGAGTGTGNTGGATAFLAANLDIQNHFAGWTNPNGPTDDMARVREWIKTTGERGSRYQQALAAVGG